MSEEKKTQSEEYDKYELQDMLPIYYKRLFPHTPFYRWLSYGKTEPSIYTHREISFTLMNDVYIRYLCYENQTEFENDLYTRKPFKIDIGAVYSVRPRDHRTAIATPIQRELVFDIDMTDYDEVRTCCSGAEVCTKCWKFMVIACQVLDTALREDFGFEHILWVFSGRRGIHCWVCDKIARHLTGKNRNAVAEYLNILTNGRITIGERMHHSVRRAYAIIEPYFEEIVLNDQNLFGTIDGRRKLLDLMPEEMKKELEPKVNAAEAGNSKAVWELIQAHVKETSIKRNKHVIEEIQLAVLYPRMDIAVSKALNHLLKAPFCVHPKTGKVCVPFHPGAVAKFDPTAVPTIRQLLKEIDEFDEQRTDGNENSTQKSRIADLRKTSMSKGARVFEEFLRKLESSFQTNSKLSVSDAKMEF